MTSFVLKIIALISMFCDHLGYGLVGHSSYWNLIGRIAFPIFAFQISEGFVHTKNVKKYFIRLLVFAIVSQIPFYLFLQKFIPNSTSSLNIFFTLLLGLLCMVTYRYFSNVENNLFQHKLFNFKVGQIIGILFTILIASVGELLKVDYGAWGIIVIFAFYLFKNNKLAMIISYICLCIIHYGYRIIIYGFHMQYILFAAFTILPIIFISLYNGKQGYKIKYLLYAFYPLHLLLLYLFM